MQPKIAEAQKHYEMCKPIYDASEYRGLHGRKFKRKFTTIQTYPSALKHLTKIKEDANAAEINKLGRDQQADLIRNIWTKEEVEIMRSRPKLKQLLP